MGINKAGQTLLQNITSYSLLGVFSVFAVIITRYLIIVCKSKKKEFGRYRTIYVTLILLFAIIRVAGFLVAPFVNVDQVPFWFAILSEV